jgi:apolipoprotein N-acyltransferase
MLVLPFFSSVFSFLTWFGFVPLFLVLENKSKVKRFLLAYFTGVLFWAGTVYWLAHVTLAGTIVLVLYLALYFGVFGIFVFSPQPTTHPNPIFFLSCTWVLLEYLRSYLLTGFPWALLGYSQYRFLPVIQISDITGVWGVSFLVMMVNVAVYQGVRVSMERKIQIGVNEPENRNRCQQPGRPKECQGFWRSILAVVMCMLLVIGYGFYKIYFLSRNSDSATLRVSVIQGNIPQELKWDERAMGYIVEKYSRMTEEAVKEKPDLIVWPEAASPGLFGQDDDIFDSFYTLAKRIKVPILLGAVTRSKDIFFNSALLIDENGQIAGRYDKLHLVPFGEYIPLKKYLPFLETVVPIGDIEKGRSYTVFKLPVTFSVLICFEDLFPELSREFTKRGAGFLVNITNDAWYKLTSAPYQHLQASVFRAVENRRYLVRSANTGISGFIAPSGKIILLAGGASGRHIFIDGIGTQTIGVSSAKLGVYTRYGDWFIPVCLIFVLCGIIRRLKSQP